MALEQAHPALLTPDSPSQRVGGQPLDGLPRPAARVPMLSLEKIKAAREPDETQEPAAKSASGTWEPNTLAELRSLMPPSGSNWAGSASSMWSSPKWMASRSPLHYRNGELALRGHPGRRRHGRRHHRQPQDHPGRAAAAAAPAPARAPGGARRGLHRKAGLRATQRPARRRRRANLSQRAQCHRGDAKRWTRLVARRPLRAVFYAVGALEGISFATHTRRSSPP